MEFRSPPQTALSPSSINILAFSSGFLFELSLSPRVFPDISISNRCRSDPVVELPRRQLFPSFALPFLFFFFLDILPWKKRGWEVYTFRVSGWTFLQMLFGKYMRNLPGLCLKCWSEEAPSFWGPQLLNALLIPVISHTFSSFSFLLMSTTFI